MSATPHTVHIEGDLSIRSAASLAKELREGLAAHEALVIDAHALTSVDISVVQVLVAAHKSAQERGRTLRIEGAAVGALGRALDRSGRADPRKFRPCGRAIPGRASNFRTRAQHEQNHPHGRRFRLHPADGRLTLTSAGYTVLEAVDGSDGYSKATSATVDAVITDLNMPNMNGIEFIRKYRTHPSSKGCRSSF